MTDALVFLVDSLITLYLYVLILRFVMQLTRADFRNQIAHAILIVTNPVIMPLRKILPPMGKIDTASVLAIVVVAALEIGAVTLIANQMLPPPVLWVRLTALVADRVIHQVLHGRDHHLRHPRMGRASRIFATHGLARDHL